MTLTALVDLPRAIADLLRGREIHPTELFDLNVMGAAVERLDHAGSAALNIDCQAATVDSFEKLDESQSEETTDQIMADLGRQLRQRERVRALIGDLPWADVDGAIHDMESAMRLALEATVDASCMWEANADDHGFEDEFSLSQDQVRELSLEWRLAYVARLMRTVALCYGVSTGFGGGDPIYEAGPETPAGILRGLNDISSIPVTGDHDSR